MGAARPVPGLLFFNIFINYQGDGMRSMLLNFQVRGSLEGLWSYWMTHPELKIILRNKKKYLWHSTKRCALFLTLSRNNRLLNSFGNPLKSKIKWITRLWITSWRWAMEKSSTLLEEFNRTIVCKLYLVTFICSALIRSQVDHYVHICAICVPANERSEEVQNNQKSRKNSPQRLYYVVFFHLNKSLHFCGQIQRY